MTWKKLYIVEKINVGSLYKKIEIQKDFEGLIYKFLTKQVLSRFFKSVNIELVYQPQSKPKQLPAK